MPAFREKLNPHLADLSRKQRGHRRDSPFSGRNAENGTIHRSGKEYCAVGSPSTLGNFRDVIDHLRHSTPSSSAIDRHSRKFFGNRSRQAARAFSHHFYSVLSPAWSSRF